MLGKTQAEVKEKLKTAISESQRLDVSKAGTYTIASWTRTWYEVYAEPRIRPNTKAYYTNYIENHSVPGIGNISLDKLTTIQIQRFYNNLQKSGRVQRKNFPELKDKSLSPRVVRGVHTLLHNCLEQAVAERLILTNPAQGCKLPQLEKKEMKILPQKKIGLYLAEGEKRGLLAAFYLELTTGLRRGEVLALQWTDLDIENRTLAVTKQVNRINGELVVSPPKTRNSIRTLAIPQQAVDLLIAERKKHPRNPYLFPSPKTGTMYGAVDKVSLRSALPTKKDALWRHPACFIIRFRFNAVADKRQWSSAASKPRRKTRAKLCSRFCAENEPSHQTCRSFSASRYSGLERRSRLRCRSAAK